MPTHTDGPRTGAGSPRLTAIQDLVTEIAQSAAITDGDFSALGMLISDASLAADSPALEGALDCLQGLYRRYTDDGTDAELRGRVLGLIDVTHWSLRRLPATLQ